MRTLAALGALLALAALEASPALAERYPAPMPSDSRIRTVHYSRDDVVEIVGHVGYTTTVFFAPSESVSSIALGDDIWRVAAEGNRVSIKPRTDRELLTGSGEADTNMVIFTNLRVYFFELRTSRERAPQRMTYAVRFVYGEESNRQTSRLRRREAGARSLHSGVIERPGRIRRRHVGRDNAGRYWGYSWQGSPTLRPLAVFDDGRFVYLRFADGAPLPAVYYEETDGQETIANFHVRGHWLVVHRMAAKLVLRDGLEVACVFREAEG